VSPRPRSASNDDILDGVIRAIARVGPARLALTDVAEETALAPATLIQRFGSKRGMLLAALERGVADAARRLSAIRAQQPSPLAALVAVASDVAPPGSAPAAVAHHLAFLQGELDDPAVHRLALERSRGAVAGYRALVIEAVAAGELAGADPGRLARVIHAVVNGSLSQWAVHREGNAARWVQDDVEAVLAPYRRGQLPGGPAVPNPVAPAHPPAGPRARHRL
jgi:AcrR family transcriptional regulator